MESVLRAFASGFRAPGAPSGAQAFAEVVAETQGELDDRVGRIAVAGRGEDARSADVEVPDLVDPAVGVDDAGFGRGRHPGRSHVMLAADLVVGDARELRGLGL